MSHDYHLLLDTEHTPDQVRSHLLSALGLTESGGDLADPAVLVAVRPADARSLHLAEPSIGRASVEVTFMPRSREVGHDTADIRTHQLAAALMRFCPGDAAFTFEAAPTSILRRGDTVFLDPDQAAGRLLPPAAFAPDRVQAAAPA